MACRPPKRRRGAGPSLGAAGQRDPGGAEVGGGVLAQHQLDREDLPDAIATGQDVEAIGRAAQGLGAVDRGDVLQVAERNDQGHQLAIEAQGRPGLQPGIGLAPEPCAATAAEHRQHQRRRAAHLGEGHVVLAEKLPHRRRIEAEGKAREIAHGRGPLVVDGEVLDQGGDLLGAELRQAVDLLLRHQPGDQDLEGLQVAAGQGRDARAGCVLVGRIDRNVIDRVEIALGHRRSRRQAADQKRQDQNLEKPKAERLNPHCKASRIKYFRARRSMDAAASPRPYS